MSDFEATCERLRKLRTKKDLKLRPCSMLVDTFTTLDGKVKPFSLRYYQAQMVAHLLMMRRFIVGDDTGCGKTIETIGALCYLWERNPNQKVIVLTKKSAVPQWAKEFLKFTIGVHVVIQSGTPKKREACREEFLGTEGPAVLISGYRSMVRDFSSIQNWEGMILVLDECFQYHTPVVLADGSTELIGKIVSQRMPVEVLSWNPETGAVEPQEIIAWHRNPLVHGRRRNLLHLNFRFGGKVRVTGAHKFYHPDGSEIPASRLQIGSEVQHLCQQAPNVDQWQFLLGGLLGDSCILHPRRKQWGMVFGHSEKQEMYLRFKHQVLSTLCTSEVTCSQNGGYPLKTGEEKNRFGFRVNANAALTSFLVQARIRQHGKKKITVEWLDAITPLGLAVWYADDGALSEHVCQDGSVSRTITLHTQGFTKDDVESLAGWLRWRWGVRAQVKTTKPRTDRPAGNQKAYPYLYLDKNAAVKFLHILPGGFPGVEYKFPGKPVLDVKDLDTTPCQTLVTDWVTEKKTWESPDSRKNKYVYNLEVAGNHNYFANGSLVSNCTMVKNPSTQVHQVIKHMAAQADRVWGLTATLIKNNLVEGFGIYQAVVPGLFTYTKATFIQSFCITRMQVIGRGRQVPIIVGYRMTDIKRFREMIDPYYLGRPKHEIATELPVLTTKEISCSMTKFQSAKYQEALAGLLELGTGEEKKVTKLTAVTYCQEIVNHPGLIECEGTSDKLDTLVDLLTEGDLVGEKVIVYTRFERMVGHGIDALKKKGVPCVRITGKEKQEQRSANQDLFQDFKSDINTVWITNAGSDAINLQAAKAIIFYDTPFSAGDFLQALGRMIRIGSIHDRVLAIHLICNNTVDERTLRIMGKKMDLLEAVLGKRILGEAGVDEIGTTSEISELFDALQADAREMISVC